MLSKQGPPLSEKQATDIVMDWFDRIEAFIGICDLPPQLRAALDALDSEILAGLHQHLQTNLNEGSTTGFSLFHIAAIMNWSNLLTQVLRRRDRWLFVFTVLINVLCSIEYVFCDC
jgi:hypothetical protein